MAEPECQRFLIWGKTYPELSSHHAETVCTGAVDVSGRPVRLYPVPLRYLQGDQQYKLYDIVEVLEDLARETGRTVPQVALNWVLRRPTIATVVVGARDEAQLRDNLGAVEFALTPEQVRRLDEASSRPPVYPYWHQRRTSSDRNPPLFDK